MAKTYNKLKALTLKKSKFNADGRRVAVVSDEDEIAIWYNENKISKKDIVSSIENGKLDFTDKVLCINKAMAEQLAD